MIDEKFIERLREYIQKKTGKLYFRHIHVSGSNILITCPFHKDGNESKPSATIRSTATEGSVNVGTFHCFTCGESMNISQMVQKILGPLYNKDEVESLFELESLVIKSNFIRPKIETAFKIPKKDNTDYDKMLKSYRYYHPYLEQRRITKDVAEIYDIGYDNINNQITFPIRDKYRKCLGIGRRSIDKKFYRYPNGMIKPLYGIYELSDFIRYLWVVEGPFNLWSLKGWGKEGVALLGTGTKYQYNQLLDIKCDGYVLCLDPDEAGRRGTKKLKQFLIDHRKEVHTAMMYEDKDVNDLTEEEFKKMIVI